MSGGVWRRRTKRWTRKLIAFLHSRAGTWTLAVLAAVLLWWTVREATSRSTARWFSSTSMSG